MTKRITYTTPEGVLAVIAPSPNETMTIEEIAEIVVPKGLSWNIVGVLDFPKDGLFRNAWVMDKGKVKEDVVKSVELAHTIRREKRDEEFAPHDKNATIPMLAESAETERAKIRDKYEVVQTDIDGAASVEALRGIIDKL